MIGRATRGILATLCVGAVTLVAAPPADAQVTTAFDGANPCAPLSGADAGRYSCGGIVETWDGTTPIDTNLFLPSNNPPAGGFPLIGVYHGWGGSKLGLSTTVRALMSRGYAIFSISDRGWGMSCGGTDPKRLTPACADGYNHLMDTRYEVRDAQYLDGTSRRRRHRRPTAHRRDRRLLRRRHVDGARGAARTASCCPTTRSSRGRAPTASDIELAAAAPGDPLDRPRVLAAAERRAPSTTRPTRPTGGRTATSGSACSSSRSWQACTRPGSLPATTRPRAPIRMRT